MERMTLVSKKDERILSVKRGLQSGQVRGFRDVTGGERIPVSMRFSSCNKAMFSGGKNFRWDNMSSDSEFVRMVLLAVKSMGLRQAMT